MLEVSRLKGGFVQFPLPSGKVVSIYCPNDHTPDRLIRKDQIHSWGDAPKVCNLFKNYAPFEIVEEGEDFFVINIGGFNLRYLFWYPNEHWDYARTKLDYPSVSFARTNHLSQVLWLIDGTAQEEADTIAAQESHFVCN